jgi:hypothetical protein
MRARQWTIAMMAVVVLGGILPQPGLAGRPGVPAASARIVVTGDPTPIETLRAALLAVAQDLVPEARDARVTLLQTTPPLQPLPVATGATVRVVLQLFPSGASAITRTLPVEIINQVAPWSSTQHLLVSNSPETVTFSTPLFRTALPPAEAVRLVYHHQNGATARRMTLTVALSNPTSRRAAVWVTGGPPNVGTDELLIGHAAARDFLMQHWRHAAFLFWIPAHTTSPLFVHALAPGEIASGLVRLVPVGEAALGLQVIARLDGDLDPPAGSVYLPLPDRLHQRGAFEQPEVERPRDYVVRGPFAMMALGGEQDLVHERDSGDPLHGNYGVLYTFPIRIDNPAPAPSTVTLAMHAVAGQAGGMFRIDDRIVDVPRVPAGGVLPVVTVRIAPGEHRLLVVSTMPESGANYPVLLTLGREEFMPQAGGPGPGHRRSPRGSQNQGGHTPGAARLPVLHMPRLSIGSGLRRSGPAF